MSAGEHGGVSLRQMLNKVPEVILYFWIIKVLCTTVGETASDFLAGNLNLGLTKTTFITGALLLVTLGRPRRAHPAAHTRNACRYGLSSVGDPKARGGRFLVRLPTG